MAPVTRPLPLLLLLLRVELGLEENLQVEWWVHLEGVGAFLQNDLSNLGGLSVPERGAERVIPRRLCTLAVQVLAEEMGQDSGFLGFDVL